MPIPFTTAAKRNLKDLAICLALGNLWFLRRWYDLEKTHTQAMNYFREGPADQTLLLSTLIASTLLGVGFWLLWMGVRRWGGDALHTVARCGFLAVLILGIDSLRRYQHYAGFPAIWQKPLYGLEIVLVVGIALVLMGNYSILRTARAITYISIFLLPAMLMDFVWFHSGIEPATSFRSRPTLPLLKPSLALSQSTPRLIWIIFDEFDQHIAFDARPKSVEMPELDRLRTESVVSDQAMATAIWTDEATPSLVIGRIMDSKIEGANRVLVRAADSPIWADLRDQPNVFQRARSAGVNAAVAGWHFPYCRVFGDQTARCLAAAGGAPDTLRPEQYAAELGIRRNVGFLFQLGWYSIMDAFYPSTFAREQAVFASFEQQRQLEQFNSIRRQALADAVDRRIGLLYLHFPIPHPYAIYDRQRRDFSLSGTTSYLDNLALVDRFIGELRVTLEHANLWDSTSLLISGDHGLRSWLWQKRYNWTPEMDQLGIKGPSATVPFILKLAGRSEGAICSQSFSSVISGDLALAVLTGRVSTKDEALTWLGRHGFERNSGE